MRRIKTYLEIIERLSNNSKIFLVGGLIRDFLLKREKDIIDCDFTLNGDVFGLSKKFAQSISGSWFVLDEKNKVYRVIKKDEYNLQFDFSALKGRDIIQDLKARDYTINALALEIDAAKNLNFNNLIDPLRGRFDLKRRLIRAIAEKNLIDDPIRILRGISLSSELGFKIERDTLRFLKQEAFLLKDEAGERISEEIFKILKSSFSYKFFKIMQELGILDYIFPQWEELKKPNPGPYHHLSVDLHSLEALRRLEILLKKSFLLDETKRYLNEEIRDNRSRRDILKLAVVLHDIGKPASYFVDEKGKTRFTAHPKKGKEIMQDISLRLKLSKKESQKLEDMIYHHLRPGFLLDCLKNSKRAVFRYFRDAEEEAVSIILLSIADKEATRGRLSSRKDIVQHKKALLNLIKEYYRNKEEIRPPKLINGEDVMSIIASEPSPLIGEILRDVEEKQALGEIKTKEEALEYVKKLKS